MTKQQPQQLNNSLHNYTRTCTLCWHTDVKHIKTIDQKLYYYCSNCELYYLDPRHHLSLTDEIKRYILHKNLPDDEKYNAYLQNFLEQAFYPYISAFSKAPQNKLKVLDFGAGEHQAATRLLRQQGFNVTAYDPAFITPGCWNTQAYTGIIAIEVFEHLRDPRQTIDELAQLLVPEGILAIQTQLHPNDHKQFEQWWYRQDPTHISFYSAKTMDTVCRLFELILVATDNKHNIIFKKTPLK